MFFAMIKMLTSIGSQYRTHPPCRSRNLQSHLYNLAIGNYVYKLPKTLFLRETAQILEYV